MFLGYFCSSKRSSKQTSRTRVIFHVYIAQCLPTQWRCNAMNIAMTSMSPYLLNIYICFCLIGISVQLLSNHTGHFVFCEHYSVLSLYLLHWTREFLLTRFYPLCYTVLSSCAKTSFAACYSTMIYIYIYFIQTWLYFVYIVVFCMSVFHPYIV